MKQLHLCRANSSGHVDKTALLDELLSLRSDHARVYSTYTPEYVISTTSKDIHLTIGELSETGRRLLFELLAEETRDSRTALFSFGVTPVVESKAIFVSRAGQDETGRTVLHLAAAV